MSPLEGFLTTWSRALRTFGHGEPADGSQFDASAALRQLTAEVESASSGDYWHGGAAEEYSAANADHGDVLDRLAELDARLAAEIDNSARIVISGRADLDDVREWVISAASSLPGNRAAEIMVMPIVSQGLGQLSAILSAANAELNAIGARIRQIGAEYADPGPG